MGCLLWVLFVAATLYFGIPVAETYFRYLEYKDGMKQELRFRANMSNDKIRAHLQAMADSLGLPAEAGDVTIRREGNTVIVEAEYDEVVKLPGFQKTIHYNPHAADTY